MYPTVVIVLVETQLSMTDTGGISSSNPSRFSSLVASGATLGPLSLAVGPAHSTTNNEAESQCSRTLQSQCKLEHGLEESFA